jgi:hypothetical protein
LSDSSTYSSLHISESLLVDALDGFAEARALLESWAPPTWANALRDKRYPVALLDYRAIPPCIGRSALNSHYERYAEDPVKYKDEFCRAVLRISGGQQTIRTLLAMPFPKWSPG